MKKGERGITLIVLIITIVVLMIIAVVTIGTVQDSGIIDYAQSSVNEYKNSVNKEKDIIDNYIQKIESNIPGNSIASTTDEGVPIPKGFKYIQGTKDTGVVIENEKEGSQFVWVPLLDDKAIVPYGLEQSSYREPDVVTGVAPSVDIDSASGKTYDAVKQNLDLAGCKVDLNGDGKVDAYDFKKQLENEFNLMATSVNKHKGFYVGRYEMSINAGKAQSKGSTEENKITSATDAENSGNTWYGLYSLCKTYSTNSVQGSMIWGSQYDAMMYWMGDAANSTIGNKKNKTRYTGAVSTDVIKNVYDLYGNSWEWTMEADKKNSRVVRSGHYDRNEALSAKLIGAPTNKDGYLGCRIALYIV